MFIIYCYIYNLTITWIKIFNHKKNPPASTIMQNLIFNCMQIIFILWKCYLYLLIYENYGLNYNIKFFFIKREIYSLHKKFLILLFLFVIIILAFISCKVNFHLAAAQSAGLKVEYLLH